MKKHLSILLCVFLLCSAAACGGSGSAGQPESALEGPPEDILNRILAAAEAALPEDSPMPRAIVSEAAAEESQNRFGLSEEDFGQYVESASVSTAMIATFAHEVSLIKAKDASAAAEIKTRIAEGYDSLKWICVRPEESCVIESGSYVLLAVSRADVVEAVVTAFIGEAGSAGERDVFFTSDAQDAQGAAGGGMAGAAPGMLAPLPK